MHPESDEKDRELLLASAAGDHEAFRRLVEKYQQRVFRICLGFVHDVQEAEDLAQGVFLGIYQNAGRFRGHSSASTWIFRIAANRSLNQLRYRRARKWLQACFGLSTDSAAVRALPDPEENPGERLERSERQRLVRKALARLPRSQCLALVLHKVERLPQEEIAAILGCSASAVESKIHRAKAGFRRELLKLLKKSPFDRRIRPARVSIEMEEVEKP